MIVGGERKPAGNLTYGILKASTLILGIFIRHLLKLQWTKDSEMLWLLMEFSHCSPKLNSGTANVPLRINERRNVPKGAHTEHQEKKHGERTYSFPISKKGEPGEEQSQLTYLTYSQPN